MATFSSLPVGATFYLENDPSKSELRKISKSRYKVIRDHGEPSGGVGLTETAKPNMEVFSLPGNTTAEYRAHERWKKERNMTGRSRTRRTIRRHRNRAGAPTHKGTVDDHAARELELYIDNDGDLYRQQKQPIEKNLANKMANGKYDHEKAVKLWMYLMESGAKKYSREFGNGRSDPAEWHRMFNVATRESAARMFATAFEAEAALGNYDHHLTKAAQKRRAARG